MTEHLERRAELSRNLANAFGLDDAILERLVRAFYASARKDELIGPMFDRVHDWEHHVARITQFWSSVTLLSGTYHGHPLPAHYPLGLHRPHFIRWLELFEATVRETCPRESWDLLLDKAQRIARSLEMGMEVKRGALPV